MPVFSNDSTLALNLMADISNIHFKSWSNCSIFWLPKVWFESVNWVFLARISPSFHGTYCTDWESRSARVSGKIRDWSCTNRSSKSCLRMSIFYFESHFWGFKLHSKQFRDMVSRWKNRIFLSIIYPKIQPFQTHECSEIILKAEIKIRTGSGSMDRKRMQVTVEKIIWLSRYLPNVHSIFLGGFVDKNASLLSENC